MIHNIFSFILYFTKSLELILYHIPDGLDGLDNLIVPTFFPSTPVILTFDIPIALYVPPFLCASNAF